MKNLDKDNYYVWHPFTDMPDFYERPLLFKEGKDLLLRDTDNNTYINSISGLWNLSLGSGNQEIIKAMIEQLSVLQYASLFRMGHETACLYAEELVKTLPGGFKKVFFTSNGSEAVETMVKAARQYYRLSGKKEKYVIIGLKRAYHGVSYGALSASGIEEDQEMFAPLVPGFEHVEPPYCLRCPYNKKVQECNAECAKEIERVICKYGESRIAGFLMEPVIGFGGVIVPPEKYFEELKKILDKYDVLFMLDEITTGFGRTGKMLACEHWDLKADMLAVGKGMSGGYAPLGAALFTDEVFDRFSQSKKTRFNHGSTYSGHPVCCAAGRKVLEILLRDNIIQGVKEIEKELWKYFRRLNEASCVGEVRGKGAMLAVEFVRDKSTLAPLDFETMYKIIEVIIKWGVLVSLSGNNIIIMPPLTIERKYIRKIYNAVGMAVKQVLGEEVSMV